MQTSVHIRMRRLCPSLGFRQYVSRGVHVSALDISARPTHVSPDGERLLNDLAAVGAPLTRKVRRYLDNSRSSFFRFEREDILERGPARVGDGFGEVAVLEHVGNPQVFDGDKGVGVNVPTRNLVRVVLALAGDLEVLLRRLFRSFTASVGALLAAGRLALHPSEPLLGCPKAARVS